jgi:hypothetical protein
MTKLTHSLATHLSLIDASCNILARFTLNQIVNHMDLERCS